MSERLAHGFPQERAATGMGRGPLLTGPRGVVGADSGMRARLGDGVGCDVSTSLTS